MRKIIIAGCVLGALALTWLLATLYGIWQRPGSAFETPQQAAQPTPAATEAATEAPAVTPSPEAALLEQADLSFMDGRVNVLLLGYDQSPERDDEESALYRDEENNYRSDVLMLAAVNFNEDSVHLISIPRDTYAAIYNTRGRWKINAAFAKGGAAEGDGFLYAQKTVEMLMGVPVEYYAGVNMEGLKRLVDAMGGVEYDVDVEIHLNGRTLEKGLQHLDGQQVLDYCRARKGISTDVGRNDRQQRMLLAIFDQLRREKRLTELPAIYAAVADDIETNLSLSQIAALTVFLTRLDLSDFKRTTLAGEYISNVYNASYYVLYNKKLIELVQEEFGITITRDKKYDVSTVKRDKAAAEAKKAAEQAEDIASMAVLPSGLYESNTHDLVAEVYFRAERVRSVIEAGGSAEAIREARHRLNMAVAALSREQGMNDLPGAFAGLRVAE